MEHQGPQAFWTNMAGQQLAMATNSAVGASPDDPARMVTPSLDGEKAGAALLFSGVLLTLAGVTFVTMGWQHYNASPSFEWTQLLGPVLISAGGTFILTSICKFGIVPCWPCRRWGEEAMEQPAGGHSFTLSGINQPIVLHSAAAMLCIPPSYNFITQDVCQPAEFEPGSSVNGPRAALPPCDAVYCADNAAFTAEEDSSAHCRDTGGSSSRTEKPEGGRGRGDGSGSTCSRPPAYEDIFPSLSSHGPSQAPAELHPS